MKRYLGLTASLAVLAVLGGFTAGCGGSDGESGNGTGTQTPATTYAFSGQITGTWQGSGLSGTFSMTIDEDGIVIGAYTGDDAGVISGTVNDEGSLSASAAGTAGVATWSGTFTSAGGFASSGNGTWTAPSLGASGTWTGSRP